MNQVLAFVMLVSVTMAVGFPLMFFGTERMGDAAMSYHDFAEQSRIRSGQSIAVTYLCGDNATNTASGTMVNVGLQDITIFAALADDEVLCTNGVQGSECPGSDFVLESYGTAVGKEGDPFVPEQIANFTTGTKSVADAVRLVTESGKLFEIPVSNVTATCGP